MTLALADRDRRALKVLAIALVAAALWASRGAVPFGSVSQAEIEALEQRYLLARQEAERRPGLSRDVRSLARSLEVLEGRLLSSATPALAQAEMRSLLMQLLEAAGVSSPVSEFGTVETESAHYVGIPIDLEFVCRPEQFVRFMTSLANAHLILATRNVLLGVEGAAAKEVRVRVTVEGYLPRDSAPSHPPGTGGAGQ